MRNSALIAPNPDPHHRRPFGMVRLPYPVAQAVLPAPAGRMPARPPILTRPQPWYPADWR
ncbi:hypothetical protein [Embleya scabrispora]|uniref:hypothetical protein n=1 Tax=Embleya scabrispora TaxID=159449 RepID=UPI00036DDF7A|nr:hypothetical protein [Embleya scabrispora]MYS86505.1 hypothetical protein [Streptomyces sp. SID5474]